MQMIPAISVMKRRGKITVTDQKIIDKIRIERLNRNISGRALSGEFNSDNPTRVGNIENEYTNDRYSAEILHKATAFMNLKLSDILPDEVFPNDSFQEKTKVPILKGMSIRGALNSLLEDGYFSKARLRSEITSHYNSFFAKEDKKEDSDFSAQLEDLFNEGKIIKIQPDTTNGEKLLRFKIHDQYDPEQ